MKILAVVVFYTVRAISKEIGDQFFPELLAMWYICKEIKEKLFMDELRNS
jgi:hypothetical protein